MLDFLALPLESDFLACFLLAAARVVCPCLSLGLPQPQVEHITSSSFVGRQSQILLACRPCLYQASFALETFSSQSSLGPCQNLARPFSYHIRT